MSIKKIKGFSLMELTIVVVVMGILSIISIGTYSRYKQRAIETEAKAMLVEIEAAQQIYYARNNEYVDIGGYESSDSALGVSFKRNKYFTSFQSAD